jgi:hypothetical protein
VIGAVVSGRLRFGLALALLLASPAGPHASVGVPPIRVRQLILHLEGTMASDRATAATLGFQAVSFGVKGQDPLLRLWLGVDKAYPLGDYPVLGKDILENVRMYDPNFFVVGSRDLVQKFVDVQPGARVVVEALTDRGSRTFYLRHVDVVEGRH